MTDTDHESDESLRDRFEMTAGHIRVIAEELLREHFGERCPDFDEDCFCCQRWKALDDLTENPFVLPTSKG